MSTLFLLLARLMRRVPMPWRTNFMEVRRLSSTAGCQRAQVKFNHRIKGTIELFDW